MHGEPSMRDDSALLGQWATERRDSAFAELVATYERMVIGTAYRRTGDAETARDVAQQVFATLASKANWLLGRQNLAGWLHYAASHMGARAARADARRRAALGRFEAEEKQSANSEVPWRIVEEAVAALPETEREAIVLHYFQDLSYPEVAAAIGIAEPAARKRVSRALASLERGLARHGLKGTAAALLAGAVAQQSAIAAPVGLAAAAAGSATAPWTLALSIMSKHTTVKLAASIAAVLVLPLAFQWHSNANARDELAALHALPRPAPPASAQQLTELEAAIAAKRDAANEAEGRARELANIKERMKTEVMYSLGTLDSMARKLVDIMQVMEGLEQRLEAISAAGKPDPSTDEGRALTAEMESIGQRMAMMMPKALTVLRDLPRLEMSPEKAGRFYAVLVAEVEGFNHELRTAIEQRATAWVRELQSSSLAFSQRPKGGSQEWDKARAEVTADFLTRLSRDLPGAKLKKVTPDFFKTENGEGPEWGFFLGDPQ